MIEIWQGYSKPMHLAFLDFEATFEYPYRRLLLSELRADGVPEKFVHLIDGTNQRATAAVRTSQIYKTIRGGNWSKTKGSIRTLPVQFRYPRHPAKNSRSVSCRHRLSIIKGTP
ncbi:hypothetical protein RB195_022733 [Necator americanus]|uniref:Exonuclease domain-containing protein n=1 Tax=Necator americanus TaxID=51031 RepID=A0ABR1EGC5_NECAM